MEMFHPFILLLLFISTLFFLCKLNRAWFHKSNLPPSPPRLPIIGNFHQLGTLLHRSLGALSKKYGPLMLLHLGNTPHLIVSSAEMAKEILKTHDIAFANRPFTTAGKKLLYGCTDIGFAPYGEYWRQIRKIVVLDLLSIKRVQSFKLVREDMASSMIIDISCLSSNGDPVDLSKIIICFAKNLVLRCALGGELEKQNNFEKSSRELMKLMGAFSFADLFPWMGWIDVLSGLNGRMKKVSRKLDAFLDQVIDEHVSEMKDGDGQDFVDLLLLAQRDSSNDIKITRDSVKAILLDMFLAGTDTPAIVIEWIMAELLKNPSIMKKTQEEVRRVVGQKAKVDEDDIYQMEYLQAVFKEALRLHPPVPLLVPRECYTSIKIKNYFIPPHTRVMINVWAIQRDPKLWERAEEFFPERFINSGIDYKGQDYEYIPFGSGRRSCPAMSYGTVMVQFAVANLLYWFDWEFPGNTNRFEFDMTEAFGINVSKKLPLYLVPIPGGPSIRKLPRQL
uniref:Cytochrome P450 n=1 Tax=Sinopodophyllum hexandrum TaxID=93608 RepID=A0A0N9HTS6_SINHE|nr:cytochrome P450 [Sinopodophyllum hexandrum]